MKQIMEISSKNEIKMIADGFILKNKNTHPQGNFLGSYKKSRYASLVLHRWTFLNSVCGVTTNL